MEHQGRLRNVKVFSKESIQGDRLFKISFIFILLFIGLTANQTRADENPDNLYRNGRFKEAQEAYSKADMDNPKDIRYRYNRGCAAYQASDYKGAASAFTSVLSRTTDRQIAFRSHFNLGNSAFKQNDYALSCNHFTEALRLIPESPDARYNLELALRALKKQKEKEKDSQTKKDPSPRKEGGEQNKGKEKNQEKPPKQDSYPQKNGDKKQNKPAKQKKDQGEQEKQDKNGTDMPQPNLDKKKAEALLNNLNEDRARFMKFRIPKDKKHGVGSDKNW